MRQIIIPRLGVQGQEKLATARVLVVGSGGLGCTILQNLSRVGVGRIRLCDDDVVKIQDLHRQIFFAESHLDQPKAHVAARMINDINHHVAVEPRVERITETSIAELAAGVDLIIDATDNLESRDLINSYAVKNCQDWIYGGCVEFQGTVMLVRAGAGACLACVFGPIGDVSRKPGDGPIPVFGPLPVSVGTLEAIEVIKYLLWPQERPKASKLISVDLLGPRVQTVDNVARSAHCPVCGERTNRGR